MATTTCEYSNPVTGGGYTNIDPDNVIVWTNLIEDEQPVDFATVGPWPVTFKESVCVTEGESTGGSTYIFDVGSTVMLGGLLMFFIAHWIVGLIRRQWKY